MQSREIKFRAVLNSNILPVYAIKYRQDGMYVLIGDEIKSSTYPAKDIQLLQYTGLKDKNGVELYAGDIVYFDEYDKSCFVVYVKAKYVLKRLGKDKPAYIPEYTELSYRESEIIVTGNIYQNPELLTQ